MSYTFGFQNAINILKQRTEMLEDDVLEAFCKTGEEAINEARQSGGYVDRTGNLRNSIGYEVITKEGTQFEKKTNEGTTAPAVGYTAEPETVKSELAKAFIEQEKDIKPGKMVLTVVAGMKYGVYVEKKHGLNVLFTATEKAKYNLENRLKELQKEFVEDTKKILGK